MTLSNTAQFINSRLKVVVRTRFSVVYYMLADPSTILKGGVLYIDGKAYGTEPDAKQTDTDLRREAHIYTTLGSHERITAYLGLEVNEVAGQAWALRLERSVIGSLREYILEHADQPLHIRSRLRMALDFAEGVQYLHACSVLWADLSTRNALLFGNDLRVKLCDFAGACLPGVYDTIPYSYGMRYLPPMKDADCPAMGSMALELFALGSAIYEIIEWNPPYGNASDREVDRARGRGEWPQLSNDNPAADIIWKCWRFQFESAEDVAEALSYVHVLERDSEM